MGRSGLRGLLILGWRGTGGRRSTAPVPNAAGALLVPCTPPWPISPPCLATPYAPCQLHKAAVCGIHNPTVTGCAPHVWVGMWVGAPRGTTLCHCSLTLQLEMHQSGRAAHLCQSTSALGCCPIAMLDRARPAGTRWGSTSAGKSEVGEVQLSSGSAASCCQQGREVVAFVS